MNEIIAQSNTISKDAKQIDSDLQTLVYANYTKFMGATDLTRDINSSLSSDSINDDLESLKSSLKNINKQHTEVDNALKLKLKKIQKLDVLRKDLDKLKYLSELPEMFKKSLDTYAQSKSSQKP